MRASSHVVQLLSVPKWTNLALNLEYLIYWADTINNNQFFLFFSPLRQWHFWYKQNIWNSLKSKILPKKKPKITKKNHQESQNNKPNGSMDIHTHKGNLENFKRKIQTDIGGATTKQTSQRFTGDWMDRFSQHDQCQQTLAAPSFFLRSRPSLNPARISLSSNFDLFLLLFVVVFALLLLLLLFQCRQCAKRKKQQ